ncbi:MAG: Rrf2 family transcriptional regulator [Candidatus Omnitrophica bacterium]|jgi:Rrf2 family iron-sulfur cluster assembly transcriptional regulator|nr:Rrf2 family transcriptional regulator [Candidatus Omnitrophota bacterium]
MINFTTTLSYGLRLLVNLSLSKKLPKQLKKIAKEEGISLAYLRKLITPLDRAGIIRSIKGPGGGFILTHKPSEIYLLDVIGAISHNKVIGCVRGLPSCKRYNYCVVKDLLEEAYNKIQSVFQAKTLATIINRQAVKTK